MQTQVIEFDRAEAGKLFRKYREHHAYQTPVDAEIERLARLIAKGKVVIRALASIREAGVSAAGLPKLAIMRADQTRCYLDLKCDGSAIFHNRPASGWLSPRMAASLRFDFEAGTFPAPRSTRRLEAIVPHIPPDIRPRRGLQNYHILWEAEWSRSIPVDPMLLRRIGKTGDAWIVCGAWDLTPVERAVLASHLPQVRS